MAKKIYLQKFIDESIDKIFGGKDQDSNDRIFNLIKAETVMVIRNSVNNFVLTALGLEHKWGEWQVKNYDKFIETRIGKYVFSDVQDAIIKEIKKINPEALSQIIEKTISKNIREMIEERIYRQFSSFIDSKIDQEIDKIAQNILDNKINSMIDLSMKKQAQESVKKQKTKSDKNIKETPLFKTNTPEE